MLQRRATFVTAQGDVYLEEKDGNLALEKLVTTGDVWIKIINGDLLDANQISERDERTAATLRAGVWSDLSLTGDAAQQKIDDTISAFAANKENEYRQYWIYRSQATFADQIGLDDGQEYYLVADGDYVGLAANLEDAMATVPVLIDLTPSDMHWAEHRLADPANNSLYLTFDSAVDVDGSGDTIHLPGHSFITGDAVVYIRQENYTYDPAYEVKLSQAEYDFYYDYYTTEGVDAAAAIQTLEESRTIQYHTLHSQFTDYFNLPEIAMTFPSSYDPAFTYTLTNAEHDRLTEGIKIWTEDELLRTIGAGLLKAVSDTQVSIEDANITAASVTLIVLSGNVGDTDGYTSINVADGHKFTVSELEDLAAAERIDLTFIGSVPVTATVNFSDNGTSPDTILRTSAGSWLSDGFVSGMTIGLHGNSENATDGYTYYTIASVSSTLITLIGDDSLVSEQGKSIDIFQVVPDPRFAAILPAISTTVDFANNGDDADTITRNSGSWLTDGFTAGDLLRVEAGTSPNSTGTAITYTIDSVTAGVITLIDRDRLVTETSVNITITRGEAPTIDSIYIDQREDVDIEATGDVIVDAGGKVYLGSESDIRIVHIYAGDGLVGDNVRIKGGESILNVAGSSATNFRSADIILEAAKGTIGTESMPIYTNILGDGTITARAQDKIHIVERDGDINVSTMYAQQGGVYLWADGSIVDALDHDFTNIAAVEVVLTAEYGGIGESGDHLDLDVGASGTVTATAQGNIYIAETFGDMRVRNVVSYTGDVDLKAQQSILDAVDLSDALDQDSSEEYTPVNLPRVDVTGNNIKLTAELGYIGALGNELDINSAYSGPGTLTSSSYDNTYIIEVLADLGIYTVQTTDGIAFITVPAGSIFNANPGGINVLSGKTYLFASGNIGESDNWISSEVGNVEAFSTTGSTWIINEGSLEIGGVSGDPGDPGMQAGDSIYLGATSPVTVTENAIADSEIVIVSVDDDNDTDTDGTATPLDKSDDADFLKVKNGITIHSQTSYVMLLAGDDLIIEAGAIIRAQDYILIQGDYQGDEQGENPLPGTPPGGTVNADPGVGSTINIYGTVDAPEILIYGERNDDCINIGIVEYDPDAEPRVGLFGYVQVFGGDGDDKVKVDELHTRGEEMDLDGQGGTDCYIINTTGSSDYIINVFDSGAPDDGADRLTINGTTDTDTFLIRRNFVASLQATGQDEPRFADTFERINYNENINARLRINGMEGDDEFYSDDNSSITTLDGGPGEDFFQIGQVFGDDRVAPFVASGDEIATIETTLGFLSRGISFPTTVFGGDGNDSFSVYSNKALLKLFGEDGNDEFVVRAFVIKGTSDLASTDTEVNGGNGDDFIQYNINAPVSIDGGAGADTVVVLGTEIDDNFVITEDGVQGAGLNIDFTAVEKLEVDGLEGNDHFFVLSTSPDLVTTIIGGLGTDTFDVGGDVTEDIIALSIEGRSGFINHSLESDDPAYNGIFTEGIQLNVADEETGTVMITNSGEMVVVEDDDDGIIQADEQDSYIIKMAIPSSGVPTTVVYITVSAAQAGFKDEQNGGKALEVSIDGINFAPALVLTFDSAVAGNTDPIAWAREQVIFVRGTFDEAEEGERTVVISHSVYSVNPDFDNLNVPNVEVKLIDDDKAGLIITETDLETQVLEGDTSGDTYEISLTKQPDVDETVTVTLQFDVVGNSQITVTDPAASGRFNFATQELTFDDTNWSQPFELMVIANDDGIPENRMRAVITHAISSTGGTSPEFANVLETPEIKVDIRDDDTAGLIVTETSGSTLVSENNPDFYDIVLTNAPTDPVIVTILADGQTIVSAADPLDTRFDDTGDIPTVTFDSSNWNIPFTVKVEVNPDGSGQGSSVVQVFPAQPHSTTEIRGPLTIEGSVIPGKDRSLKMAVMLPTETDGPLPVLQIEVDETQQTDTLNIFNDGSVSNDIGLQDNPDHVSGLAAVYEVENSEIDLAEFANVSGLNMGGDFALDFGTPGNPDIRTFDGGVTYHGIEVVDILLGQGNDQFTVETTISDVITVIQGGGKDDYIVVNGGGGSASPLIIFGDTSQNGLFYDSTTAAITGNGREFSNHGNDIIDARTATQSVAIYGGRGNDIIYGSQAGDHIAGGSGDDTIYAQAGADHIYGDSGFNINLSMRISMAQVDDDFQILTIPTAPGLTDYALTNDQLAAGQDTINGQEDNDIIFGDHGVIEQTYGTERIQTTANVERIFTVEPLNGDSDTIHGNDGIDRILGGNGEDIITGDAGTDIIIGDNGWVDYNTGDDDLATVDLIKTTDPTIGSSDNIQGNADNDIIIGGVNSSSDVIVGNDGDDIILGDNGLLDYDTGDGDLSTLDLIHSYTDGLGGADIISGNAGNDTIMGGSGADVIYGDDATAAAGILDGADTLLGDNGEIILSGGMVALIHTTDTSEATGGADTIKGNAAADIIIGGVNGDVLYGDASIPGVVDGDDVILGDNGELDFDTGDGDVTSLDLVETYTDTLGGADTISGNAGNDTIIGGSDGDIIFGNNAVAAADANDGEDILIGDNGRITLVGNVPGRQYILESAVEKIETIDISELTGGADTIEGNACDDVIIGGVNGDVLYGDAATPGTVDGDDIILGDNGELDFDTGDGDVTTLDLIVTAGTEVVGSPDLGGSDTIRGNQGNDIILGSTAGDLIHGGGNGTTHNDVRGVRTDFDLIIGDHGQIILGTNAADSNIPIRIETLVGNVGGDDTITGDENDDIILGGTGDDTIDGNAHDDLILGDNGLFVRRVDGQTTNPGYRVLTGQKIYDEQDNLLLDHVVDPIADQAYWQEKPSQQPDWNEWILTLYDGLSLDDVHGNDYIAGGSEDDTIFGQLGDDIIQGDGSIVGKLAQSPVSAGRNNDGILSVNPSFEAEADGDDYIEGNAGDDLIFGNLGQDDIIGGSSELFGYITPAQRQDGSDIIFGGAGTDITRNNLGDESEQGHARDADMILGDNGNIFRLVGINGVYVSNYLTFGYDNYTDECITILTIIPRAAELLDYTPGGVDYYPTAADALNDIGAADEIHGESGDDFIYGMKGDDVLFGEGQDDDIVGGYDNDWIAGGTGDDGVIGDDGRIYTSRNGTAEPLYGIGDLKGDLNQAISTPGRIQQSTINVSEQLKKTVNLTPFKLGTVNTDYAHDDIPSDSPLYADDIIYGGWGNDFLHGGDGDDAISGAEALEMYYLMPYNPGDILGFSDYRAGEFAAYNEYDPWAKVYWDPATGEFVTDGTGIEFLLNFDATEGEALPGGVTDNGVPYDPVYIEGDDVIFGDLGNDWLVGGTGRDHLYGGFGYDLMNVDDDHETNGGANDAPDTHPSYEDIAYGGAGRDVLIANTGGDRLIDWCG